MKNILLKLSISLGTILLLLALFEVVARLRYEHQHALLEALYKGQRELCTRHAADPRLIYDFAPNRCGYNSQGFADVERSLEKADGTCRIVVIGDSVAQGQFVPERNKRFDNLLAERLNSPPNLRPVEIINLARTGYSTSQELVILEKVGLTYNPDLIIWSYVLNDPAHPVFHDANGHLGLYYYRPRWYVWHYLKKKLFLALENSKHDVCGIEFHQLLHCAYRNEIADHIRLLGKLSRQNAIPVLFIIHPVFERSSENYSLTWIHEDLRQMAEASGLKVVDLTEAFRGVASEKLTVQPWDPWHPNELGNRLIADYLYKELRPVTAGCPRPLDAEGR